MQSLQDILSTIEVAVNRISGAAAKKQDVVLKEVLMLAKKLETKGDNLLNSVNNLKLISTLKSKIEGVIIDARYKNEVKSFADSYSKVQDIQNEYFSQFATKYKPKSKTLDILRQSAVETTLNGLLQTGIEVGVVDGIKEMLLKNISNAGSYVDLIEQLRSHILTDAKTGEGSFERHINTYANTAINQFSAEYNKAVADDLGLEWYMFDGSLLETSRSFCVKCCQKKYIHVSEFTKILKGDFGDLGNITVSKKSGLPSGLMKGTTPENFVRRRGGWNCGHQMIAVDEIVVPQSIKEKVYSTSEYKAWAVAKGKPVNKIEPTVSAVLSAEKNQAAIAEYKKNGFEIYDDLLNELPESFALKTTSKKSVAHYDPLGNHILIGDMGSRTKSKYFNATILAHESGHAIHYNKNIIKLGGNIREDFENHFKDLRNTIKGKEADIHREIMKTITSTRNDDLIEQAYVMFDILGSLTKGRFGGGHNKSYYKIPSAPEAEIFAHSVSLLKVPNEFEKLTPELESVVKKMREYIKSLL